MRFKIIGMCEAVEGEDSGAMKTLHEGNFA
jgi:hypothetical protein